MTWSLDISKYSNTQNKVTGADFWANHPFHVQLEELSLDRVGAGTGRVTEADPMVL